MGSTVVDPLIVSDPAHARLAVKQIRAKAMTKIPFVFISSPPLLN
jgi:hypothetical protein